MCRRTWRQWPAGHLLFLINHQTGHVLPCLSSPEWTTIWLYNCEMIKDSGCQLLSIEFTGMRILEINFKIKVLEWSQIYDNFPHDTQTRAQPRPFIQNATNGLKGE